MAANKTSSKPRAAATKKSAARSASPRTKTARKSTSTKSASRSVSNPTKTNPATKAATKAAAGKARSAAEQLAEYQRKRDFTKTAEPSGATSTRSKSAPAHGTLRFIIQKHDASHLHYDLRLEIDGVMKSWAVPKGPSADPTVRRLAMQVEDHPVEYNTFEGTIPAGEYGGGTVMLWDTGTYTVENAGDTDQNDAAREAYDRGDFKVNFHGKRIKGSYAIVRTKGMRGASSSKPSWLLIKHRDDQARPESDEVLTEKFTTSVTTKRSMDRIASDNDRVWS